MVPTVDEDQIRSDLVIVANRLPVNRVKRGKTEMWKTSPGGLVSALKPIIREMPCTWVGWTGASGEIVEPFMLDDIRNQPVNLTASEVRLYYEGFSNGTIWPLYHDAIRTPEYHQAWWDSYVTINRRFARAAADAVNPDGVVWIHDYHLQLLPAMLRELQPDIRIGFFLHIPFPPQELFARLPWRREIIDGLLGADVLGFQTSYGAKNFLQVANRFADADPAEGGVAAGARHVNVSSFPISVDVDHHEQLASSGEVITQAAEFCARLGTRRTIMLGVDRLDYTKGIDLRMRAFRDLLRSRKVSADECVLVQLAVPTRERVEEYKELRQNVERLVGEINGEFGELGRMPVQYLHRSVNPMYLASLYAAANVMLVTPLRDGMNLVAKEFVASKIDETGVLVLSEFAGAARELKSAVQVNPYDSAALVDAMDRALHMSVREQAVRMKSLRRVIKANDVYHWAQSFMDSLAYARV